LLPIVSIIVPTYNGVRYIAETIQSILQQTYKDFEIIVIDDGSTDETVQVIHSFGKKVRYFYQSNRGPASARNIGIQQAKGKYIALIDHDDLWLPNKLEKQVPILEKMPGVGLVYSDAFNFYTDSNECPNTCFDLKQPYAGKVFKYLFIGNFIPNLTVLVRKECFEKIGYFDVSGKMRMTDDYHMWLQVSQQYDFEYIDQPLAKFRRHQNNMSRDDIGMILDTNAALKNICKEYPECIGYLTKQKRFSELIYKLGRHALMDEKPNEAVRFFYNSLIEYPLYLKSLIFLVISLWRLSVASPSKTLQTVKHD
jgi:glycosyltransferase involved in cell wall biosynthesis